MKYLKTDVGQQAFKERSPLLSARQRSAFILFDGSKTVAQVLASTAGLGVTPADIEHMVSSGLLQAPIPVMAEAPAVSTRTAQQRYAEAYPLATKLTASLGLRGFKLNLAVEAASGHEDLQLLLPRIQEAVGHAACVELEQALRA